MNHFDPLGEALLEYLNGKHDAEILVRSPFEHDRIPASYLFRGLSTMPELEKRALIECKGKVLDVGAGAGCHSLILQEMGHEVIALDVSSKCVEVMRGNGVKNAIHTSFLEHNGKYDTILMLMNGIGIAGKMENLDDYLKHAIALLNKNGKIVLDSSDIIYALIENNAAELDMKKDYYGEVEYEMVYNNKSGGVFNWLFVDFETLSLHANRLGGNVELIADGENYSYLASISL